MNRTEAIKPVLLIQGEIYLFKTTKFLFSICFLKPKFALKYEEKKKNFCLLYFQTKKNPPFCCHFNYFNAHCF